MRRQGVVLTSYNVMKSPTSQQGASWSPWQPQVFGVRRGPLCGVSSARKYTVPP